MKIEKMNDHQIRCTLTSEDLATRNIKLSELAYGSEKTRALFRDMMQQAAMDFGFEAEDIPLMVEAIPLSSEKIVVIITKVESPDELDTRFSNFTQFETEEDESDDGLPLDLDADSIDTSDVDDTATQFLQLLQRLRQEQNASKTEEKETTETDRELPSNLVRIVSPTVFSDIVNPGLRAFVESHIRANTPCLPSSPSLWRSIGSPYTGV